MKSFIKTLFISILFITTLCVNSSYAIEQQGNATVYLQPNEVYLLDMPEPIQEVIDFANQNQEITSAREDNDPNNIYSDDDICESKVGKAFIKLINNTAINNKYNRFPSHIKNEINARAP